MTQKEQKSFDIVLKEAQKSAEITHNHPEGIKGAQSVALGVMLCRQGNTKKEIIDLYAIEPDFILKDINKLNDIL